jgi:ABC-type Fe3+-hydroxamate transport system substrate-binding protein
MSEKAAANGGGETYEQPFEYELILCAGGLLRMTIGDRQAELGKGSSMVVRSGERTPSMEWVEGTLAYVLRFGIYREFEHDGKRETRPEAFPQRTGIVVQSSEPFFDLCDEAYRCWPEDDPIRRFRGQCLFQEMLYRLFADMLAVRPPDTAAALEISRQRMEDACEEEWTIERLAKLAGLNPHYYMQLFKKKYGVSAIDYLTARRVEKAKEMLTRSDSQLRHVARRVGYSDEFYFSRKFKQQVGMSPTVYKKSRLNRIAAYGYPITGQLLALQLIPYAAALHPNWSSYYIQRYGRDISVHLQDPFGQEHWAVNQKKLHESRPEAIISTDWLASGIREEMGGLASSFIVPWIDKDWRGHLMMTAQFLNKTEEASSWLDRYDEKAEIIGRSLRSGMGDAATLMIYIYRNKLFVCGAGRTGGVLYRDLKLASPPRVESIFAYKEISAERLGDFAAERMLVVVSEDEPSRAHYRRLCRTKAWQALPSVRSGRIWQVSPDPWLEYSAMGNDRMLDAARKLWSQDRTK